MYTGNPLGSVANPPTKVELSFKIKTELDKTNYAIYDGDTQIYGTTHVREKIKTRVGEKIEKYVVEEMEIQDVASKPYAWIGTTSSHIRGGFTIRHGQGQPRHPVDNWLSSIYQSYNVICLTLSLRI